VKTENWREITKNKEKCGINEHDKITQYFPHNDKRLFEVEAKTGPQESRFDHSSLLHM
jgi:hypothetical protein